MLVVALSLAQASPANAQQADAALAEALFREGKALMKAGKYEEACPKLAESNRVDPATGTLLALAFCHERQGKTATAWGEYDEVAATATRQGNAERARVARERTLDLEPRLSRLTVVVGPDVASLPGLHVTRDGAPLGEPTWGSAVPVDPGDHVVQVAADRKKPLSRNVVVGAHADRQTITISALDDDAPSAPVPNPTAAPLGRAPASASPSDAHVASAPAAPSGEVHRPIPLPVYVAAGVGLLGLASFTYFGLTGRSEYFDLKDACGPHCTKSDVASTHTKLVVADVSLGISILSLGVAAYLFFSRPSSSRTTAASTARPARLDVRPGADGAGAFVGRVF